MDIAFTTDFWTSAILESFMTMSMHWITRGWRHENAHLGGQCIFAIKIYCTANISDRLLNACIDFGVWPKDAKGRIPKSEEALRCNKLAYFGMEPPLERPVLTSDCGNYVLAGAKKNSLWDWNRCAYHCLNRVVQSALKRPCYTEVCRTIGEIGPQVLQE